MRRCRNASCMFSTWENVALPHPSSGSMAFLVANDVAMACMSEGGVESRNWHACDTCQHLALLTWIKLVHISR